MGILLGHVGLTRPTAINEIGHKLREHKPALRQSDNKTDDYIDKNTNRKREGQLGECRETEREGRGWPVARLV